MQEQKRRRKILQNTTKENTLKQKSVVQKVMEPQISNAENQLQNVNNEVSSEKSKISVKSDTLVPASSQSVQKKKRGRPTRNPNYVLTPHQIGVITAFLLTDGWLSLGSTYSNPSHLKLSGIFLKHIHFFFEMKIFFLINVTFLLNKVEQ